MKLIMPLLALFIVVGLARRTVRTWEIAVLIAGIVLLSVVYLITWSP
jgi:hypothetical protein